MHNGITQITAGGKTYRLRFGRMAYEEFMNRQIKAKGQSHTRMTIDLVFAGLLNEADVNDEVYPTREVAHNICETIWSDDPESTQFESIWNTYFETRDGKPKTDLDLDKKKEDLSSEDIKEETTEEQDLPVLAEGE